MCRNLVQFVPLPALHATLNEFRSTFFTQQVGDVDAPDSSDSKLNAVDVDANAESACLTFSCLSCFEGCATCLHVKQLRHSLRELSLQNLSAEQRELLQQNSQKGSNVDPEVVASEESSSGHETAFEVSHEGVVEQEEEQPEDWETERSRILHPRNLGMPSHADITKSRLDPFRQDQFEDWIKSSSPSSASLFSSASSTSSDSSSQSSHRPLRIRSVPVCECDPKG